MNKRWTPGSDAVVTKFPITKNEIEKSNLNNICEGEDVKEYCRSDTSEDVRSIMFAFAVVFSYFSGAYLLNKVGELTFDNVIVLTVLVCLVAEFVRMQCKKDISDIIDFKEPKI
jgi:hypothetical protein